LSSQRPHGGFRLASDNARQSIAGASRHRRAEVPANNNWPAVLTRAEAAEMCRISVQTFDTWVRKGILPGPIPGTRRWSRIAIERALAGDVVASTADIWPSPFEQWKLRNAH
jgi:helix-turn-helix protein